MFKHPENNSLFTFSPAIAKIKKRRSGQYVLKTKSAAKDPITWFTDTPARETGRIPNDYFAMNFNLLFNESTPNASFNFLSNNNINEEIIIEITDAEISKKNNRMTRYTIQPINKRSRKLLNKLTGHRISRPYLFIDDSSSEETDSTAEKIIAGAAIGGGAGVLYSVYNAYAGYIKSSTLMQVNTNQNLPKMIEGIKDTFSAAAEEWADSTGDDGALAWAKQANWQDNYPFDELLKWSRNVKINGGIKDFHDMYVAYKSSVERYILDLRNFLPESSDYISLESMTEFLNKDSYYSIMKEITSRSLVEIGPFTGKEYLKVDALEDQARNLMEATYTEVKKIFDLGDWESIDQLYANAFNMRVGGVSRNVHIMERFDKIARELDVEAVPLTRDAVTSIGKSMTNAIGTDAADLINSAISDEISGSVVNEVASDLTAEALGLAEGDAIADGSIELMEVFLAAFL